MLGISDKLSLKGVACEIAVEMAALIIIMSITNN